MSADRVQQLELDLQRARMALRRIASTETFTTALDLNHLSKVETEAVIAELHARMRHAAEAIA